MSKTTKKSNKERNKGLIKLILILLVTVAFAYFAVNGFDTAGNGGAKSIKRGLDLEGGVSITYETVNPNPSAEDLADTRYKLQKRVEAYSTESEVRQEGTNRISVDIPGVTDANKILQELGNPGSLSFMNSAGEVLMTGDVVTSAQAGYTTNQTTGATEYLVQLTFNEEGAALFKDLTEQYLHDYIYIVYDGEVVSAPIVQSVISGGSCQIENISSYDEAAVLATTIRIGALPLELQEVRATVVGAKLGEEAIQKSLLAGLVGLLIIMALMIAVYRVPGVAASIALVMYTALVVLLIAGFELTLTLPGIAGVILGVGMAVDANVIIFARIREEIAKDKGVRLAIKDGFRKALSAILDGNITTLIVAVILILMASGTIKGFAQTLIIGIVVSMFTALVITRLMVNALYELGFQDKRFYGMEKHDKQFDFVARRKTFFGISAAIIAVGVIFMVINATGRVGYPLNYGLEFVGGTSTDITFPEELDESTINTEVAALVSDTIENTQVETQKVTGTTEAIVKTRTLSAEERNNLNYAFADAYGVDIEQITSDTISASVSTEMRNDAILSVIVATICMLIYIWIRFKDIRFGASAIIALIHDVLVVVTCYAIFKWSVGNSFIACILTIVGYSINATIVIFDRIREHLGMMGPKDKLEDLVNASVNETLSRSILTSLTTFIAVAVLYILGVSTMREFALPLMIGIVCGTYSSVCLTGAMWYMFRTKLKSKAVEGKPAADEAAPEQK